MRRIGFIVVAAVGFAAAGMVGAADAGALAPGVSCKLYTCTNTTDIPQLVSGSAQCPDGTKVEFSATLAAHSTVTLRPNPACVTGTPNIPFWY